MSGGVRGIKLDKGGRVVSLEVVTPNHELFSITEKGFGKRTPFDEYRVTNRGGQGIRNYQITPKTGAVTASRTVHSGMELIVISRDGIVIRTRMDQIRMTGRAAQGVSVINVAQGDAVASLATIEMGNSGPSGPKGAGPGGGDPDDDAEQGTLDGIEPPSGDDKPSKPRKPTPIRGRGRSARAAAPPPPKKSAPKPAAAKPAPRPAPKSAGKTARPAAKTPARRPAPAPIRRTAGRGPKSARLKRR
jgi:hypothetical protein